MLSDEQLDRAMALLQVSREDVRRVFVGPTESRVEALSALKERVRKRYRQLALEYHPDRTGGDPVKTDLFQDLTEAARSIRDLEVTPARRPRRRQRVGVVNLKIKIR